MFRYGAQDLAFATLLQLNVCCIMNIFVKIATVESAQASFRRLAVVLFCIHGGHCQCSQPLASIGETRIVVAHAA